MPSELPPVVLVVDENPENRAAFELTLTEQGFWASGAGDTNAALEAACELSPDVIVTETRLPGDVDVFTMLRTLRTRESTRHTPIIAIAGDQVARVRGVPFAGVLTRPVTAAALTTEVRGALARSAELRRRATRLRARIPQVLARSRRALDRSLALAEARAGVRRCPTCASELQYVETRTLQAATFDYFEPCTRGCGLFCFDRAQRRLIAII